MAKKVVYDKIEHNVLDSGFDMMYKIADHIKITNGTAVVTVFKPKTCPAYDGKVVEGEIIKFSATGSNELAYADVLKVFSLIERAIDLLNAEGDNLIDRAAAPNYNLVAKPAVQKKTLKNTPKKKGIPAKEREIGGIYEDEDGRIWLNLGRGKLFHNRNNINWHGGENAPVLMRLNEHGDEVEFAKKGDNEYIYTAKNRWTSPSAYSSTKKFIRKIDMLPDVDPSRPIVLQNSQSSYDNYTIVQKNMPLPKGFS